jgi:predicted secreted Zn-dependent protease
MGSAPVNRSAIIAASLAVSTIFCGQVSSQPHYSTKYTYYTISGNNAGAIYATMVNRGPRVGGVKAYAKTSAVSTPSAQIIQGKTCKLKDYRLNFAFNINLPRLKNEAALSGNTKTQWRNFANFLKVHEETHRSIWLEYGAALEAKVWNIKASSCDELAAKIIKLRDQMGRECSKKQDAFDAAEQKKLMRHPFVRLVLLNVGHSTKALAVVKKK